MNEGTSKYPSDGRGKYKEIMESSGYVEDPLFKERVLAMIKKDELVGYFCGGCEHMKPMFNSVTGYWCQRQLFPDQPWGCCDYYQKKD